MKFNEVIYAEKDYEVKFRGFYYGPVKSMAIKSAKFYLVKDGVLIKRYNYSLGLPSVTDIEMFEITVKVIDYFKRFMI